MYVCYVLAYSPDNQSTTYLKAYERIRCVRSGHSKKLVEIIFHLRRERQGDTVGERIIIVDAGKLDYRIGVSKMKNSIKSVGRD